MYSLSVPTIPFGVAYETAFGIIRPAIKRLPYDTAKPTVHRICLAYDQLAAQTLFHSAIGNQYDVAELAKSAMADLYDNQFAKLKGTRAIRNAIKNAAPNKICPYCGEGTVSQLDHYLPKAIFAGTSVHPPNLVPVCSDCNKVKLDYAPGPDQPAVLHPYFDRAFAIEWLHAQLEFDDIQNPIITFFVSTPTRQPNLELRLQAHMRVFNLYNRFSVWAAQSIENFERLLQSETDTPMDLAEARKQLLLLSKLQSGGRTNSWERSAHLAMRASSAYLTGRLGLR